VGEHSEAFVGIDVGKGRNAIAVADGRESRRSVAPMQAERLRGLTRGTFRALGMSSERLSGAQVGSFVHFVTGSDADAVERLG
jgi:hypothetical protein